MVQQSMQYDGLANENPNIHLYNVIEICNTFKSNDTFDNAIKLRLFLFSLISEAKLWFYSLSKGTINTWEHMV